MCCGESGASSAPCWQVSCPAHQTLPFLPPALPKRVELAPLPHWQPVGENLTLRCQVEGGVPRTYLSVLLLRGEEVLSWQSGVKEPTEFTTTVLAGRGDHGANFSCRTELDLRPKNQGLFQNSSVPRQLRTFGEALGSLQETGSYGVLAWREGFLERRGRWP